MSDTFGAPVNVAADKRVVRPIIFRHHCAHHNGLMIEPTCEIWLSPACHRAKGRAAHLSASASLFTPIGILARICSRLRDMCGMQTSVKLLMKSQRKAMQPGGVLDKMGLSSRGQPLALQSRLRAHSPP